MITTAAGKQSVDTVNVTIGGRAPTLLAAGQTIQSAIDAATPGDLIIIPPSTYNEPLLMWKPVRLQGEAGRTYWMAFSNKDRLVKPGDHVDVVIGNFRAIGLVMR